MQFQQSQRLVTFLSYKYPHYVFSAFLTYQKQVVMLYVKFGCTRCTTHSYWLIGTHNECEQNSQNLYSPLTKLHAIVLLRTFKMFSPSIVKQRTNNMRIKNKYHAIFEQLAILYHKKNLFNSSAAGVTLFYDLLFPPYYKCAENEA